MNNPNVKTYLRKYKWQIAIFTIIPIIGYPFIFLLINKLTGINLGKLYTFELPLKDFMTPWIDFWVTAAMGLLKIQREISIEEKQQKHLRETRFSSGVELLGNEKEIVRITGINNIISLAVDYPNDYLNRVCEILCAHVRVITTGKEYLENYKDKPSNEIQTIIDLLFRKKNNNEDLIFDKCIKNLKGAYLSGIMFTNATLTNVSFTHAIISYAELKSLSFDSILASGVYSFRDTILNKVSFTCATLSGSNFSDAKLSDVSFRETKLTRVSFGKATLSKVDFHNTILEKNSFYCAKLNEVYISSDLSEISFEDAKINNVNFEARTINNPFDLGKLNKVSFKNSKLNKVKFFRNIDDLSITELNEDENEENVVSSSIKRLSAFLKEIDFLDKYILSDVNFSGATLSDVDFFSVTLKDVDFSDAKLRKEVIFKKTIFDNYSYEQITKKGFSLEKSKSNEE